MKPALPKSTARADRGYNFLDAAERERWHLKVIADREDYFKKNPRTHNFQNLKRGERP